MGAAAPAPTVAAQTGALQTPQLTATYAPTPMPMPMPKDRMLRGFEGRPAPAAATPQPTATYAPAPMPMPMPKDRMLRGFEGRPAPAAATPQPTAVTPQPTAVTPQPVAAQPQPFNVNQAAAGALQGAIGGTQQAMTAPLQVGAYMNPYQQEVIDRTQQDIERQRQMAMNTLGAQATRARAFGGSRQGVAEGVLAGEYGRMAGDIAAQQRQAGYTQAMDAAMRDRAARAAAASQLGGLGQQAFQTGQAITAAQERQGLMQQALQQTLIDAARQQYAGYTGAPQASLAAPLAALGVVPNQSTTTQSVQRGLFDYLTLPFMAMGMR